MRSVSDYLAELEEFRGLREALEASVLPLATSVDGRRFEYQASLHGLELEAGGYVVLDAGGESRLGQVLSLEMEQRETSTLDRPGQILIRVARGAGTLLESGGRPFHDALVRPATPDEVAAWLERTRPERPRLEVGELALARGVPCALDAGGFGRHTFMCGQSGSGKTYSLGVLLERLLMETSLRLVVLDPNSDYVHLGEPRADAPSDLATRYRGATGGVAVRSGTSGPDRIRVRFRDLSSAHQAAALRLDPLADREEYAQLTALLEDESMRSVEDLARSQADALKLRARNLGVDRWALWPGPEGQSLLRRARERHGGALHGGGPGVARDPGGAGAHRGRRAGAALEPARPPRAGGHRDRRGPQRVPGRAWRPAHRPRHRGRDPDRRRGTQVRPLSHRRNPAAAEGARERALAMRQPRPDAHELDRGSRPRGRACSHSCHAD